MRDPGRQIFVASKPRQRSYGAWNEEEAVAESRGQRLDMARQHRRDRDAGQIVVGEGGVANVAGEEHRVAARAREKQFSIGEAAGSKHRINDHAIAFIGQFGQVTMPKTEPPSFIVV